MLAQNFMDAKSLGLTDKQHAALIATLHALDRGELAHGDHRRPTAPNGFNMDRLRTLTDCGTVACLKGWAEHFAVDYELFGFAMGRPLRDLFMYVSQERPETLAWKRASVTPEQAAHALRNYLTTGESNWNAALAEADSRADR